MEGVMTRATTLFIAIITFLDGVASLTAAPCSVNSPPCDRIIDDPQPTTVFFFEVSDAVDPATVDATDFTLNGISANSVILVNKTWIQFIFNTPPQVRDNYAKFYSRSHPVTILVFDEFGLLVETHEHSGDFREP
jgi:hypothetical protein